MSNGFARTFYLLAALLMEAVAILLLCVMAKHAFDAVGILLLAIFSIAGLLCFGMAVYVQARIDNDNTRNE